LHLIAEKSLSELSFIPPLIDDCEEKKRSKGLVIAGKEI
jgi:hypothetical protein